MNQKVDKYNHQCYKSKNPDIYNPILLDLAHEKHITGLQKKYKLNYRTIKRIQKQNTSVIHVLKQELANQCVQNALKYDTFITKSKLERTSAHSLVAMKREEIYTSTMLQEQVQQERDLPPLVINLTDSRQVVLDLNPPKSIPTLTPTPTPTLTPTPELEPIPTPIPEPQAIPQANKTSGISNNNISSAK